MIYENNQPKQITLKYNMDVEEDGDFILSYQPHTLKSFTGLLKVKKKNENERYYI